MLNRKSDQLAGKNGKSGRGVNDHRDPSKIPSNSSGRLRRLPQPTRNRPRALNRRTKVKAETKPSVKADAVAGAAAVAVASQAGATIRSYEWKPPSSPHLSSNMRNRRST